MLLTPKKIQFSFPSTMTVISALQAIFFLAEYKHKIASTKGKKKKKKKKYED